MKRAIAQRYHVVLRVEDQLDLRGGLFGDLSPLRPGCLGVVLDEGKLTRAASR